MRLNAHSLLYSGAVQHRRPPASRARSHGLRPELGNAPGTEALIGPRDGSGGRQPDLAAGWRG
jgi:hypothetical protein